jgi:hypothetical protein
MQHQRALAFMLSLVTFNLAEEQFDAKNAVFSPEQRTRSG